MPYQLTPEQERVVHHPLGQHARVLAVAGSGKSTTMAHRIKHLILDCQVAPSAISVLMFNSLARKQFTGHLLKAGLADEQQPAVHTFHSFSFQLINQEVKNGALPPNLQYWLGDRAELNWLTLKRAINSLEKARIVPADVINPELAATAISLWKGSLIPANRAGSRHAPYLPEVYRAYEQLRHAANALTFDDFIPTAVRLLEENPATRTRYTHDLQHLIVDEYQDVNFGQQRLIELLAGKQADVMVVGDDDQTIYEWRGARPNYILQDFANVFRNKPVVDYTLPHSFRFGPLIACYAANLIALNTERVKKPLVAFQADKTGFVSLVQGDFDASKSLADQIEALTGIDHIPPAQVIVLARLFAQLDNLEAELIDRRIPYRVDGQRPFFQRQEIDVLLSYIRLALAYNQPVTAPVVQWFLLVANKPSRMLSHSLLNRLVAPAKYRALSLQAVLEQALDDRGLGLNAWQEERLADLGGFLEALQERVIDPQATAGSVLAWMISALNYRAYFQDYYGPGEHADEKKSAVQNFIRYVTGLHLSPIQLLDYLETLDTTQGKPDDQLIILTTIFRTKGLEFDYVFLPQCDDKLIPYLKGERMDVFDTSGQIQEFEPSPRLESERRLFYVALTRARKGVFIGATGDPSRFLQEMGQASQPLLDPLCLPLPASLAH